MAKFIYFWTICFLFMASMQRSKAVYNVLSYGARPDGRTDSAPSFLKAWTAACNSKKPALIYVPKGTFLMKSVKFSGPCKSNVIFIVGGNIVAPSNYWDLGNVGAWIMFYRVNGLSVYNGVFDARGASFWACRNSGGKCPAGARSISIMWCNDVVLSGVTSMNGQIMNIAVDHSTNVMLRHSKILAPSTSPNTDGIHIESSSGIRITNCVFKTGDDCISIGQGTKNMMVDHVACGPGHGISIGSLAQYQNEEPVENVTVSSTIFTGTQNGVRIKTWQRPIQNYVKNINFRYLRMNNVQNPIIIDQNYCPDNKGCPHQSSGIKISQVTYKDIKGTSGSPVAVNFICSSSNPCTGLTLENINLTYQRNPASSSCLHAHGTTKGLVIPKSCL